MFEQSSTSLKPIAAEQYVLVGVTNRLEEILITGILRDAGYAAHIVDTITMAQNALLSHEFQIIMLDCNMTDVQKSSFSSIIPSLLKTKGNPVLIGLLMDPSPELYENLQKIGFQNIIQAPLTQEKILTALENAQAQRAVG